MKTKKKKRSKAKRKPKSPPKPKHGNISDMELVVRAKEKAIDCKLKPPFNVAPPTKQYYGWSTTIREDRPDGRSASLRFDLQGKPTLWELTQIGRRYG